MKLLCTFLLAFLLSFSVIAQEHILNANPGPPNNGGNPLWGIFFDLIAGPHFVTVTHMTTASTAAASAGYTVEFFVRDGSGLGGPVGSGPGSSSAGWTSLGVVPVTQGATGSGVSLVFATPPIPLDPGDTVGVAVVFTGAGPRYFGTGAPPYGVYSDANLTLITGDARSTPFTPGGTFFTSRELVGSIQYDTTTVPVELTSFTASVLPSGTDIELRWSTATEINNSGFAVESKLADGQWISAGFVDGHGTTTEAQNYSFIDRGLKPGIYSYRIKQTDYDGTFKYYELAETMEIGTPLVYELLQNYPNPFNPATTISFQIKNDSHTSIVVFDQLGNEVATLVNEVKPAGVYNLEFNASNLASGVYYYRIVSGEFTATKKMILMK